VGGLVGVLAALVVAVVAVGSGWAAWGTALLLGVVAGLLVMVALLRRPAVPGSAGSAELVDR
jgi:hypothetical protein